MKNFPIEHEGKTYWISRAVGVAGYIFTYDDRNGQLLILANKRGKGTPDFQGYWNCPCGYLDYDETTAQACSREIFEETNLRINPKDLHLFEIEDSPSANKQNVTFRYWAFAPIYLDDSIYAKGEEENEVEDVKWIPVDDIDLYDFAFNQKNAIKSIVKKYLSSLVSKETLSKFNPNV